MSPGSQSWHQLYTHNDKKTLQSDPPHHPILTLNYQVVSDARLMDADSAAIYMYMYVLMCSCTPENSHYWN